MRCGRNRRSSVSAAGGVYTQEYSMTKNNASRKIRRAVEYPVPSRVKQYLKWGLNASGMLLQEMASVAGWIMMRGHYNMGWAEYEEREERRHAYKERECLRLLARHKFLETKRVGDTLMVRLTEKGWQQALRDKIRCTKQYCKDNGCIVVVFDVPESEAYIRRALRQVLFECGFTMLQKSVWTTRKEVLKDLCALLQGANLEQWVRILSASEIRLGVIKRMATRTRARFSKKISPVRNG